MSRERLRRLYCYRERKAYCIVAMGLMYSKWGYTIAVSYKK
jgi:hypothetical protein